MRAVATRSAENLANIWDSGSAISGYPTVQSDYARVQFGLLWRPIRNAETQPNGLTAWIERKG